MPGSPDQPRWVDRLVVEAVHFDLVRAHGGLHGVRDDSALESALARPLQRFAYEDQGGDLASLAASYGYGIARNHPFHDGNKRIALLVMAVFLGLNGHELVAAESDVVAVMLRLAAGDLPEEELATWVRSSIIQGRPRNSQV